MIDFSVDKILYIEPTQTKSAVPLIDDYTKKMTAALRRSRAGVLQNGEFIQVTTAGVHLCVCGTSSDNDEHVLEGMQFQTNLLATHYLAWHRQEVPPHELAKIDSLPNEYVVPSAKELQ